MREAWLVDFVDGSRHMRELLGGKGANLAEMTRVLGHELVPAGFTITTEACVATMRDRRFPDGLLDEVNTALRRLEVRAGRKFGDPDDPLLVSVRSGARESMPGMLETVLNLGLNDTTVAGLAERTANPRFAADSYRRFAQMFGTVVCGVARERFEAEIRAMKAECGVRLDTELDAAALADLTARFRQLFDLPQDPRLQLEQAIRAVFDSWSGERAIAYRRIHGIPDDWGTAVNVQQMVFGNKGETSGSGVAFSRDAITGAPEPSGDFLDNAQGEDVVAGVRNPRDLTELRRWLPDCHADLMRILRTLEDHYKDMQDCEFTIEEGRLYILQTRSAQRPAQAGVRFAVDAAEEGLLTKAEAIATLDAGKLDALLHPRFDPDADYEVIATGVPASPGAAKGAVAFTVAEALERAAAGQEVILVRPFTEADDVAGFQVVQGILTSEGGKASHAALVARGMGVPAVTGAATVDIDPAAAQARIGDLVLRAGDEIALDGTAGVVTSSDVPLVEPDADAALETILAWSDEIRRLGVRANADTPADARRARAFGAEGIGLCRTEHMFLGERQELMAAAILAPTEADRRAPLAALRRLQEDDFQQIFEAMNGLPVTIRLLDPPLHEFLPHPEELDPGSPGRARAESLQEANPMLGLRGVRLGILHPEIYEMQAEAIAAAMRAFHADRDAWPAVEIMIPLVAYEAELARAAQMVEAAMAANGLRRHEHFSIGTMIELPRACFIAEQISAVADFFSFGTNDLTQTALGISRDDIEGTVLAHYLDERIVDRSPFETLDGPGVGRMVRMGAWLGKQGNDAVKLGVCGEHGGDPDSIAFFDRSGLDYVSCSPFRVPIARVAAAQAAIAAAEQAIGTEQLALSN